MLKHTQLVKELDALAAMEPRDYHPGSSCQVQDLIHPSLCKTILFECIFSRSSQFTLT
jgi:hypothetical protein